MRLFVLVMISFLLFSPCLSHAQATKLMPPLSGDMTMLKVYDKPQVLPEIVLGNINNGQFALSSLKGRLIVLNVWATWCPPCVKELPSLNALQYTMDPDKFKVVNVSLDITGAEAVKDYLNMHNYATLQPYVDSNSQVQSLEILNKAPGIPISIFIDPQMRALAMLQGDADWNGKSARAVIDYYMANVSYLPYDVSAVR